MTIRRLFLTVVLVCTYALLASGSTETDSSYSSSDSSSSPRVLQNGQIPGYRACIERLAATCPRCPIKMGCDEVGGDNYKPGTFPTCEKYAY